LFVSLVSVAILYLLYIALNTSGVISFPDIFNQYALFIFVLMFFQAVCQVYTLPLIANGDNKHISIGRFLQNMVMVTLQIGLYFCCRDGLLLGLAAGLVTNILYFAYLSGGTSLLKIRLTSRKVAFVFKKFYKFPVYSSWAGLVDALAVALPILVIGTYFGSEQVGVYFLVYRVFMAPMGLLARAISYVGTKEFSDIRRQGLSPVAMFLVITMGIMLISACYFIVMQVIANYAVVLFGSKWHQAEPIIRLLSYVIPLICIASPMSVVLAVFDKNEMASVWQVLYLLVTAAALMLHTHIPFYDYLLRLVIVWVVMYVLYWFMSFYCVISWRNNQCVA
jgi:O-antigen/teichoic acid export membrane protein